MDNRYRTLKRQDTSHNPESRDLFQHSYREQSARVLQRRYRQKLEEKNWYDDHKKSEYKYQETLKSPLSLQFLREPKGNKWHEHAEKIKAGRWLELDFNDPEFERNLYKALRLGELKTNAMVTALLLYQAQIEFKNDDPNKKQLHQFRFDDESKQDQPYSLVPLQTIPYATAKDIEKFKEGLKKLPESERCYFTVNFSRIREIGFLFDGVKNHSYRHTPFLQGALKKYIHRQNDTPAKKQELLALVDRIGSETDNPEKAAAEAQAIMGFILEKDLNLFLNWSYDKETLKQKGKEHPQDRLSSKVLINFLVVKEKLPDVVISPDYQESDPTSPLLAFIVPSISAFNELQQAVHGNDSTDPYFTAGQINTRLIRYLDEKPEVFGRTHQSRPVELAHPDLIPTLDIHGGDTHNFLRTWHDLFHCWRNGANTQKPFIRHLRRVLTQKGYEMSKSIYGLVDLDIGSHIYRKARETNSSNKPIIYLTYIVRILEKAAPLFWTETERHDDNLLIIIDLAKNPATWTELLGVDPELLFDKTSIVYAGLSPQTKAFLDSYEKTEIDSFRNVHAAIKELIASYPKRSNEFYVMAYRLKQIPNAIALCEYFEKAGWNQFFYWARNSGLYFKGNGPNRQVEKLPPETLHRKLMVVSKQYALADLLSEQKSLEEKIDRYETQLKHERPFELKPQKESLEKEINLFLETAIALDKEQPHFEIGLAQHTIAQRRILTNLEEELSKAITDISEEIRTIQTSLQSRGKKLSYLPDSATDLLKKRKKINLARASLEKLKSSAEVITMSNRHYQIEEKAKKIIKTIDENIFYFSAITSSLCDEIKAAEEKIKYRYVLSILQEIIRDTSGENIDWWKKNTGYWDRATIPTSPGSKIVSKTARLIVMCPTHYRDENADPKEIYTQKILPLLEAEIRSRSTESSGLGLFSKKPSELNNLYLAMRRLPELLTSEESNLWENYNKLSDFIWLGKQISSQESSPSLSLRQ